MIANLTASRTGRARALLGSVPARLAMVVLVVLAGPAMLAGLLPGAGALAASCASADEVHAGLVVDFGNVDTGTARPANTSDCVADPGGNAVALLARRFGKSGVRIGSNGLICAIGGYPATGCGEHLANGKYRYWSYWIGVGDDEQPAAANVATRWLYSPVGPASRTIENGSVDGWHYVEGSANPSDGAPGNSSPAGPCPPVTPTSPTTPTTAGSGGSSGSEGSGGSGGSGGSAGQATPTSNGTGAPGGSGDPSGTAPSVTETGAAAGADPATDGTGAVSPDGTGDVAAAENAAEVAGSGSGSGSGSGGGVPLAAIGVAVAVVALGAGAATRFRGRTDE